MLSTSTNFDTKHALDYKTPMYLVHFDDEAIDFVNLSGPVPPSDSDLMFHLPLDDGSGTTATDESNGNNGTLTNGPTWVDGLVSGKAVKFVHGSSQYIDAGNAAPLNDFGNGDWSVAFWFQSSVDPSGAHRTFFGKYEDADNRIHLFYYNTTAGLRLVIEENTNYEVTTWIAGTAVATLFDGEKHHVAVTVNRTAEEVYLYVDGAPNSTVGSVAAAVAEDASNAGDFVVGARAAASQHISGTFDEFRVYDTVLTAAEIRALATYARPTKPYLESISGLTRTITPDQGSASVGGLKIKLLDADGEITALLATDASYFHRKKTVVKAGYLGMTEADMLTIFTGWVTGIKLSRDGLFYEISITDPQKWMQRKIFRGSETSTVTLSGNPINILLAILTSTGAGTNGTHDYLPAVDSLGIDTDFIDVTGIEGVRDDYFPGTSHKMSFTIKERVKAKGFIEKEILKPLNLYPVVDGQGRYSIKPAKPPIEAIDSVQFFDEDVIVGLPTWDMNLAGLINEVEFHYDWDSDDDEFDSQLFYIDSTSLNARGPGKIHKIASKGLNTGDGAADIIARRKNAIFDRYKTPPIKISASCFFTQLLSEPGDVVPFTHALLPDVEAGTRGLTAERMEIVSIGVDWKRGLCKINFLQTGFDKGTYQVITPTMTVTVGTSATQFTVSTADAAKFERFTTPEIQLCAHTMRQKVAAKTLLTVNTTTGVCTCDDLGETPVAGDIIAFADYGDATAEQKLWGYIADGISIESNNELGAGSSSDPDVADNSNTLPWVSSDGMMVLSSDAGGYTGRSIKATTLNNGYKYIYVTTTEPQYGEIWLLRCYHYNAYFALRLYADSDLIFTSLGISGGGWKFVEEEITIPEGTMQIELRFGCSSQFYAGKIDDLIFKKISGAHLILP